jgi:ATP-dependent phosphofructokinase / diphosphate-dependent phosphofructokinase
MPERPRKTAARAPRRIAILTGGGDCPGLNAVIRAVVKTAENVHGWEVYGVRDGFEGFLVRGDRGISRLDRKDIAGILPQGGTMLGASNACDLFAVNRGGRVVDESARVGAAMRRLSLDALVLVGGEGTHKAGAQLFELGVPVVGVPKTIDNDLGGTDVTFGFDTAVGVAMDAIDRLHSTAASHHRVMCLEVMGRHAGWIALHSGIAGGADVILLPEVPYDPDRIASRIASRVRHGRRFSIVVVAEGAKRGGGAPVFTKGRGDDPINDRLGGVSFDVARELGERTGLAVRNTVLGHVQRGGSPSATDRVLATRFGVAAVDAIARGRFGHMVALRGAEVTTVPIREAVATLKTVDPEGALLRGARELGISFAAADGSDDRYDALRRRHGAP